MIRRCPACGGTIMRPLGIVPAGTPTPIGYYGQARGGEMAECEKCGAWLDVPPHISFMPPPPQKIRLTGWAAIDYARETGAPLCKYADPVDDARDDLTVAQAIDVATDDPSLVYLDAEAADE
jgi:hypothetical protein